MAVTQLEPAELRQVIGDDDAGLPLDRDLDRLGPAELRELHAALVLLRVYDERSVIYHRQGRIGTYAIFWNHEAIQAGSVAALEPQDWVFPSYREAAIGLLRGMPVSTVFSWWRGHPTGWWNPEDFGVASVCVPIATQIPHAVGFAWGKKLQGEDPVALVFFGDGATSEGAFHEGLNFAAVMTAPVVLLCNNNQWAISTPLQSQTKARCLADKALGYGIPSIRVDGLDVLAVFEAVREGVARARDGGGPTFVEAVHYRVKPHGTADDPNVYIDLDKVEEAESNECVGRFERYLLRRGVMSEQEMADARVHAHELVREGMRRAEAEAPPEPSLIFDHAFAEPLPSFARDLAELRDVLGK